VSSKWMEQFRGLNREIRISGIHGHPCEQLINTLEIRQLWPNCPVVGMLQDRAGYKLSRSARALVTTLVTYMGMSYKLLDVICKSVQNFHVFRDTRSYCIFYEKKISVFLQLYSLISNLKLYNILLTNVGPNIFLLLSSKHWVPWELKYK